MKATDLTPYHGPHSQAADVLFEGWRWWHVVVSAPLFVVVSMAALALLLGCTVVVAIQSAIQFLIQRGNRRWWLFGFTVLAFVFHQYANMEAQMMDMAARHQGVLHCLRPGHDWQAVVIEFFVAVCISGLLWIVPTPKQ